MIPSAFRKPRRLAWAASLIPLVVAGTSAVAPDRQLAGENVGLDGTQIVSVHGGGKATGPASMSMAFDEDGVWRAFVPWAGIYRGTWSTRGRGDKKLSLDVEAAGTPAAGRLLDQMARLVTHTRDASAQPLSYAIRAKRRRDRIDLRVRAHFLTVVDGEMRRGVYRAKLRGRLP